jgi:hypothetical protein
MPRLSPTRSASRILNGNVLRGRNSIVGELWEREPKGPMATPLDGGAEYEKELSRPA